MEGNSENNLSNRNGSQKFNNPTKGLFDFDEMVQEISDFINEDDLHKYSLIVGTDSEQRNGTAEFVSVVVVHRIGNFGRYFWHKHKDLKTYNLRDRIYKETMFSLELGHKFIEKIKSKIDGNKFGFEIHVDIGENGPTKEIIKEVVGMIRGNGFEAKIKPDAYGATKVADKHV